MTEVTHHQRTLHLGKRARRAESPRAALERQRELAERDTAALYDFTVIGYPLLCAAPIFRRGEATSASLPPTPELQRSPERALEPEQREVVVEMQNVMAGISRAFLSATNTLKDRAQRLQTLLERSRLIIFKVDFGARKRFVPARTSDCLVCLQRKKTVVPPCCARRENTKTICYECLEHSAFRSSELGTKNEARCPFCSGTYPVYDAGTLSAKKRKHDE
jgi:hypothetical protein